MDAQKVLSVLDIYAQQLEAIKKEIGESISPTRQDPTKKYFDSSEERWQKLSHIWWAIEQCRLFVQDKRMEKAFRWLGFIQGALWHAGVYSVEELANHSRPAEEKPDLEPTRNAKEWSDDEFLSYVAAHCTTERALFSMTHVRRLIKMAGAEGEYSIDRIPDTAFRSMHEDIARPLIKRARERLAAGAK